METLKSDLYYPNQTRGEDPLGYKELQDELNYLAEVGTMIYLEQRRGRLTNVEHDYLVALISRQNELAVTRYNKNCLDNPYERAAFESYLKHMAAVSVPQLPIDQS